MSAAWTAIGGLAVATFVIKASGPVLLGALVVVETFAKDKTLVLDARAAGLLAAGAMLAARLSVLWAVGAGAAAAALVRAIA